MIVRHSVIWCGSVQYLFTYILEKECRSNERFNSFCRVGKRAHSFSSLRYWLLCTVLYFLAIESHTVQQSTRIIEVDECNTESRVCVEDLWKEPARAAAKLRPGNQLSDARMSGRRTGRSCAQLLLVFSSCCPNQTFAWVRVGVRVSSLEKEEVTFRKHWFSRSIPFHSITVIEERLERVSSRV